MPNRKLNMPSDQRNAMLRNLTTALLWNGKIVTTEARAKEIRPIAEKIITLAIREYKHTVSVEKETPHPVVEKLFREVAPKYDGRKGGYTRILKLGPRRGDASEMCVIELV